MKNIFLKDFFHCLIWLILFLFFSSQLADSQEKEHLFKLNDIEQMFINLEIKEKYDFSKPNEYRFFFGNYEPEQLERAVDELTKMGFKFIGVYSPGREADDEPEMWELTIEIKSIQTPFTLYKLCEKLETFASSFGIIFCGYSIDKIN